MGLPSNTSDPLQPLDPIIHAAENPGKVFSDLFVMGKYTTIGSTKMWEGLFSGGFKGMGKGMYEDALIWTKTIGPFFRDYVPGYQEGTWTGDILKRNVNDNPELAAFLGIKIVGAIVSLVLSFFGQTYSWALYASLLVSLMTYLTGPGVSEAYIAKLMEKYRFQRDLLEARVRDAWSADIFSGDIFLWLAGGSLYNACYAGGTLLNPTGLIDPLSRGLGYVQEVDTTFMMSMSLPYESNAGGVMYNSYLAGGKKGTVDALNWGRIF